MSINSPSHQRRKVNKRESFHYTNVQGTSHMKHRSLATSCLSRLSRLAPSLIIFLLSFALLCHGSSAATDCYAHLETLDTKHDHILTPTEYVQVVNAMSGGTFKSSIFLVPFAKLPDGFRAAFNDLAGVDGNVNISGETTRETLCLGIDSALATADEVQNRQGDEIPISIEISSSFVISNENGLVASDLGSGFKPHDDLVLALDVLAENVVKQLNESNIEFVIDSTTLNEIYDMECPDTVDNGTLCQSVFATSTIDSNDSNQTVSQIQDTYSSYLQQVINLGFLEYALRYASEPEDPVLKVLNETEPMRPEEGTIAPTSIVVTAIPPTFSPENSTASLFVIPNKFEIYNTAGLMAANFTTDSKEFQDLQVAYAVMLQTLYEGLSVVQFSSSDLVDIIDEACVNASAFCQAVKANHTVVLAGVVDDINLLLAVLEDHTSEAIDGGLLQSALEILNPDSQVAIVTHATNSIAGMVNVVNSFILTSLSENFAETVNQGTLLYSSVESAYDIMSSNVVKNAPGLYDVTRYSAASARITGIVQIQCPQMNTTFSSCLDVSASYDVKFYDESVDVVELQRDLTRRTEEAIQGGELEGLLRLLSADDTITVVTTADTEILSIFSSFVISSSDLFSSEDLLEGTTQGNILSESFLNMSELVVDVFNNSTNGTTHNILFLPESVTILDVIGTLCNDQNSNSSCFQVLMGYNVTWPGDRDFESTIVSGLMNATNLAIDDGMLQALLDAAGDSSLSVQGTRNGPLLETPTVVEVPLAFAVSSASDISLEDEALREFGVALANLTDSMVVGNSSVLVPGSGVIEDVVPIDCPKKTESIGLNETFESNSTVSESSSSEQSSGNEVGGTNSSVLNATSSEINMNETGEANSTATSEPSEIWSEINTTDSGATNNTVIESNTTFSEFNATISSVAGNESFSNVKLIRRLSMQPQRPLPSSNKFQGILELARTLQANESSCFAMYASFQVQSLTDSVDSAEVQALYTEAFQMAKMDGSLEEAANTMPWLNPLQIVPDENITFSPPTSAPETGAPSPAPVPLELEIDTAYVMSSPSRINPDELQEGALIRLNLEQAMDDMVQSVVLTGSNVTYLPGSTIVTQITETTCPIPSNIDDVCYLVLGSYKMSAVASVVDEKFVAQEYSGVTKQAIDSGSLQNSLLSIDSQTPFTIRMGLLAEEVTISPTQPPTTEPTLQPTGEPSINLSMPTSAPSFSQLPTAAPTLSQQPSSVPSWEPSAIPSALPSASLEPTIVASNLPSGSSMPSLSPSDVPSGTFMPSFEPSPRPTVTIKSLSSGSIAGITIGVLLCLILCCVGGFFGWKNRDRFKETLAFGASKDPYDSNYNPDYVPPASNDRHGGDDEMTTGDDADESDDVDLDSRDVEMGRTEANEQESKEQKSRKLMGFFRRGKSNSGAQQSPPDETKDLNAGRSGDLQDDSFFKEGMSPKRDQKYGGEDPDYSDVDTTARSKRFYDSLRRDETEESSDESIDESRDKMAKRGPSNFPPVGGTKDQGRPKVYSDSESYSGSSGSGSYSESSDDDGPPPRRRGK